MRDRHESVEMVETAKSEIKRLEAIQRVTSRDAAAYLENYHSANRTLKDLHERIRLLKAIAENKTYLEMIPETSHVETPL